jgi:hypothetical protein
MKKPIPYLFPIAFLLMACGITVNLTPEPATVSPTQIEMPSATVPVTTEPATQPVVQANVICNKLSLYLDPLLGSGYNCQTIAENASADAPYFALTPEYIEVTFQNYALAGTFFEAHIDVFPVQRYSQLAPDLVNPLLADLQSLIAGGTAGSGGMPLLPIFNAAQVFYGQAAVIQFQNGQGVRYLTEYAQYSAPINNHDLFYTFQGLTNDGQSWVSVILPISNPILPANGDNPPNGQSWEDFSNSYETYLSDITAQLNLQSPGSFTPTINMLDALINSIVVQP